MNNFEAVIDVGSKNLKLGIFNNDDKSIYSSKQKIDDTLEKSLNELNRSLALENLSMGMSADYLKAIKHGSTFVRIGSSIFGARS